VILLCAVLLLAAVPAPAADAQPALAVVAGKSVVLDSSARILRVAIANGDLAEAVAVSPRELLVNGKAPGETTMVVWLEGGGRTVYELAVRPNPARVEEVEARLAAELPGQPIRIAAGRDTLFLTGTADDKVSAARAAAIAGVLGKAVNLLRVKTPAADAQVLLRVRFANVDRAAQRELGANLFSTGALNTTGSVTTGSFAPPRAALPPESFSISDALNIFLFRRDLDLGATIRALAGRNLLEILAEPNVLAIDGKPASFVSGGEFPFPTLQGGGAGLGAVTIQFREFGVRIGFLPHVTPRGTIRLQVTPEVSSLDFANGLTFQGFHIPALATRRVQTEVELASGQSFVIAGLLDNRLTETVGKVPGLGDIPLLGKIFQSQTRTRNHSELLVLVTPELVEPLDEAAPRPELSLPRPLDDAGRPPAGNRPGRAAARRESVPVESLETRTAPAAPGAGTPQAPLFPMPPEEPK
jgi:pilus assembly protein CpaC